MRKFKKRIDKGKKRKEKKKKERKTRRKRTKKKERRRKKKEEKKKRAKKRQSKAESAGGRLSDDATSHDREAGRKRNKLAAMKLQIGSEAKGICNQTEKAVWL